MKLHFFCNFVQVKNLVFISLSFLFVLQTVHINLDDLIKVPDFFEHYQEHKIKDGDNFFSFLNKHYGAEEKSHHSEDPDHNDLPFHHNNHHLCADLNFDFPPIFKIDFLVPTESESYFFYKDPFSNFTVNTLHQPPKNNC